MNSLNIFSKQLNLIFKDVIDEVISSMILKTSKKIC